MSTLRSLWGDFCSRLCFFSNLALPKANLEHLFVFVCNPCVSGMISYLTFCCVLAWALEGQEPEDDDD